MRTSSGSCMPVKPCWPNGARPRPRHERRPARAGSLGRRPAGQAAAGPAPRHQSQGGHRPAPQPGAAHQAQQGPDGSAYPTRKRRKEFKGKNGRIKRQKAAMFAKIRTAKHLKTKVTGDQIEVGFFGWVARVAHVHHEGLTDNITKKGSKYAYPTRRLLGLSNVDRMLLAESLLRRLDAA